MGNSIIESDRLLFRPITREDTEMVLRWRNSEGVKSHFLHRIDVTREEHMNWLDNKVDKGLVIQFIIIIKETGRPIGSVYFSNIDRNAMKGEYGIFIGEEDELGKGYGTETVERMVRYFLYELGFHKLSLRVLEWNTVAIKGYERAGFIQEGRMVDEICVDGKYETVIFMAVINGDDKYR